MRSQEKAQVVIYTRRDCHLCHLAEDVIRHSSCANAIDIRVIDIDTDPELAARFNADVPVVFINGFKVFKHRITAKDFCNKVKTLSRKNVKTTSGRFA